MTWILRVTCLVSCFPLLGPFGATPAHATTVAFDEVEPSLVELGEVFFRTRSDGAMQQASLAGLVSGEGSFLTQFFFEPTTVLAGQTLGLYEAGLSPHSAGTLLLSGQILGLEEDTLYSVKALALVQGSGQLTLDPFDLSSTDFDPDPGPGPVATPPYGPLEFTNAAAFVPEPTPALLLALGAIRLWISRPARSASSPR